MVQVGRAPTMVQDASDPPPPCSAASPAGVCLLQAGPSQPLPVLERLHLRDTEQSWPTRPPPTAGCAGPASVLIRHVCFPVNSVLTWCGAWDKQAFRKSSSHYLIFMNVF